ncbi:MAG TPA: glycoside hydrolase 43 family protein [Tepidisphaeraceae bacterium]|nr:glycoside hydrolase 43 family protein [Tepidisphaeraceae bacterium]
MSKHVPSSVAAVVALALSVSAAPPPPASSPTATAPATMPTTAPLIPPSTTRPQPNVRFPWSPDQRDGTYRNPIICADYSDPDVVRDGQDYWLVASSFTCTPALPILHSRDLVNWTIVNHAVRNLPDPRGLFHTVRHGEGVWAPAIRKHAGKFWIFFPMPDEGIYVTTADDPRGKWSEPHLLVAGKGLIDPCPLWDDDGKAYLVHAYARSRAGIKDILRVRPMAPDASKLLGEGQVVYSDPPGQPTLEGPKFLKRDGWYYISAPAGGVATGWQLILRSRNVFGPYEPKKVLEQGPTPINGPHQGAIVDTPDGNQWWFVHFQDADAYGRITHLQPVTWQDGWPLMGTDTDGNGVGEPVLKHAKPRVSGDVPPAVPPAVPQTSDDFEGEVLALQWQWQANHSPDWASLSARKGSIRLPAVPAPANLADVPSLLLQKLPAREFSVETKVELTATSPAVQAGLAMIGAKHAALVVQPAEGGGARVALLVNNEPVATMPAEGRALRLRIQVRDGGICTFAVAGEGGPFAPIGGTFQATPGRWVGAKVGIFCRSTDPAAAPESNHADFDYFRFAATE